MTITWRALACPDKAFLITRLILLASACLDGQSSDPHRHHDIPVLVLFAFGGA
jgi:hypothetical protein